MPVPSGSARFPIGGGSRRSRSRWAKRSRSKSPRSPSRSRRTSARSRSRVPLKRPRSRSRFARDTREAERRRSRSLSRPGGGADASRDSRGSPGRSRAAGRSAGATTEAPRGGGVRAAAAAATLEAAASVLHSASASAAGASAAVPAPTRAIGAPTPGSKPQAPRRAAAGGADASTAAPAGASAGTGAGAAAAKAPSRAGASSSTTSAAPVESKTPAAAPARASVPVPTRAAKPSGADRATLEVLERSAARCKQEISVMLREQPGAADAEEGKFRSRIAALEEECTKLCDAEDAALADAQTADSTRTKLLEKLDEIELRRKARAKEREEDEKEFALRQEKRRQADEEDLNAASSLRDQVQVSIESHTKHLESAQQVSQKRDSVEEDKKLVEKELDAYRESIESYRTKLAELKRKEADYAAQASALREKEAAAAQAREKRKVPASTLEPAAATVEQARGASPADAAAGTEPDPVEAWLSALDSGRGSLLKYAEKIRSEFGGLDTLAECVLDQPAGKGVVGRIEPELWKILGATSLGHKLVLANGIIKLREKS